MEIPTSKSTVTEVKNSLEDLNSRFEMAQASSGNNNKNLNYSGGADRED
jgi:hypothetical protein